ncbi:T9SS type A sorting domain-containing protein [Flavobacterium sp.]|uniref:T9SS type A sorting domain-containing protein n=1 Tax=Flavobacterium sp. TaxID=239 RepID=UPI00286D8ED5|nr:T9SS type A sorting domain-containing protein [Flavobacterium sp.]
MTRVLNHISLIAAIFFATVGWYSYGQNAMVGNGFGGSWGGACSSNSGFTYFSAGAGSSYISPTLTPSATGDRYWRLAVDFSGTIKQLPTGTGADVVVAANTTYTANDGCTTSGAYYINVSSTSNRYIIKTQDASSAPSRNFVIFQLNGAPITISSVTNPGACPGVASTITATLSGSLPSGQAVYLRYSTDNFSTSTVTQLSGSGITYSATIPGATNANGATVRYYIFTSGTSNVASNGSNADLYTINFNNSGGTNYSYTVSTATPATPGTITGTTSQCPSISSQVYSVTAVSGASTYTWTVPAFWSIFSGQGTNSITVTTGGAGQNGDITVTAGNSCGTSGVRTLAVTVANLPPTITSPTNTAVNPFSATLGGNISSIGCSSVTERGIYYSTSNGFGDGAGTKVFSTGTFTTGTFTQSVTGLSSGTLYYYKAFATNSGGPVYTTQGSFTTTNPVTGAKIGLTFNGTGPTWRFTGAQDACDAGSAVWPGTNLGSLPAGNAVVLVGANMVAMTGSTTPQLFYRVYKQGDTPPGFLRANLTTTSASCGSTTKYESAALNISLAVSTYAVAGTYNFEVYHQATNGSAINMGTSSSPYTATFTVTADNPTLTTANCGTAETQIDLAWTKNAAGSNVMIVRSADNTFTNPTQGTAYPVNNTSLGGDTVIYNGSATSFSDTGLTAATQYYYKFYTSNNTCYSTGTTANATTRTSQPGTITGTVTQCAGAAGQIYSIAAVTGATSYTWTIPAGWSTAGSTTNSITVTAGAGGQNGDVSVVANNTCGASTVRALAVNVVATPATPGSITGTITQCASLSSQTYSISAVTYASTYTWTVPAFWSISLGQGTTSITVTTGGLNQGGDITVTAGNSCGTSGVRTLAVTVTNLPPTITSPTNSVVNPFSATLGGNISSIACSSVTERGIYCSTLNGFADGTGTKVSSFGTFTAGTFTQSITGLSSGTLYYYKAFATNSGGTVYTTQGSFTTDTPPILAATTAATAISSNAASSGGNVTSDGGDLITERGIVFSTNPAPVIGGAGVTKVVALGTTGSFSANLTGLVPLTLYYVRSYAINGAGTTYGSEISFTTIHPVYSGKAYFTFNNGSTYYTGCNVNNICDPGGNGAFDLLNNVVNVGSVAQGQNINIGGNLIQSGTVFTAATMYYRVYKSGNIAPSYNSIALANNGAPGNGCNSADTKWERPSSFTTMVAGLNSSGTVEGTGTYVAEIYYTVVSGGITYTWYKTGVTPFQATFTVTEDIFSAKIALKIGATTTWFSANHNEACDPGGNANFNSKDFGVIGRNLGLSIGGNMIANTAVTNAYLRYRVYSTSIADPSSIAFQTINLTNTGTTSCSGTTKKEQNTPQVINTSFFNTDGDYFIEVYFEATDLTGVVYFNNSNSNFKATISLYLPTPAAERDANDGNYDPSVANGSGIYESYMGVLLKDESGNPLPGLNRVFDMDGALSSINNTNFDFGTQNPGLSFNIGTETKIFTKGTHTDCGCSSWYYVYKDGDPDPNSNDFPLPDAGLPFTNQINGKFTLLNSSVNFGSNQIFTRTTGESANGTTYTSAYNALLTAGGVHKIKYKDYTDPTTGVVSTIKIPVNSVLCPTCSGSYRVAVAMLAWVSTNGDCNDASKFIYHRDINKNKITDAAVVLNPNHPDVPTSNAGSPSKNTLPGTTLFYISKVTIGASGGTAAWNGTTWSNGPPSVKKDVTMSSNYSTTTYGSFSCNDMTVNDGVTVTITNGNFIEALNTVTTTGTAKIIIENSGNFVQRCDEKTPSAHIEHTKYTRSMTALDYVYWGSPVLENVISQFPSDFDWKYRWQSGTNGGWQGLTTTVPAEGFITRILTEGTNVPVTFTGTANNGIVKSSVLNYALSTDPQTSYSDYLDFALIANPYPCAIDAKTFLSNPKNDSIESTLYFWTSITPMIDGVYLPDDPYLYNYNPDDYATWNFTGGTATMTKAATAAVGVLVPTGKIASGQGFFVEVKKDGDVYFDNSARLKDNVNTQFFKKKPSSKQLSPATTAISSQLEEGRIWLNVSNKGNFRQLLLGYVNGATNDYDSRYDGLANTDSPISIYTLLGNKDLVIQGRQLPFDQNEIVPVGYETSIVGDFYFNIDDVDGFFKNQNIYLKDNLLGIEHDLKQSAYLFSTGIGRFDKRFELSFTNKVLGINKPSLDSETVTISTAKDLIKINSTAENIISATIYDLTGKKLLSKNNLNNTNIILDKPIKLSGVFIIKVKLFNNQEISRKVVF